MSKSKRSLSEIVAQDMPLLSAVSQFRYNIRAKATLTEPLYVKMASIRDSFLRRRDSARGWSEDEVFAAFRTPSSLRFLQQMKSDQSIYEDSAAAIILIVVAEMERFYRFTGKGLYFTGSESYVKGVKFSYAISRLANQYKHLGEWLETPDTPNGDAQTVQNLVDNPFRTDAAAEFLRRCNFDSYYCFEARVMSCTDDFVEPPFVLNEAAEIPSVRVRSDNDTW
jgi:hypothetical protein